MKMQDRILLLLFGLVFWVAGTAWYAVRGSTILEATNLRYWANFILTPLASAGLCLAILRWSHIPTREWASAALLIALPGMFGEALVLSRFSVFMPRMQAASAGRYGALLFLTYALFLSIAEMATLRAT